MAIHTEYSLRHKVEFRPDEFADDPRTFAHPAIRIICAPNRYGIGDEQTWHRSQTPMPTCRSTSWTTVPCTSA